MMHKKSSFLISLFLILFLSVNLQNITATIDLNQTFSEERALGKIISDVQGDVTNSGFPELDLLGAWMGDDDQHLFFIVKYDFVGNDFSFVNVTIRTETNELFLIMVFATPTFGGLMMTHATSLVDDAKNTGEDCFFVDYTYQDRVQWNIETGEISFYIDWVHLGRAHQEIDVVFWSGLSSYAEYDKMPDQEFANYKTVIADRNVLFNFDPNEEITEFISDSLYCEETYGGDNIITETVTITKEVTVTHILTDTITISNTLQISIPDTDSINNDTTINPVLPFNTTFAIAPLVLWGVIKVYKRKS